MSDDKSREEPKTEAEIDAELRNFGLDPDKVRNEGRALGMVCRENLVQRERVSALESQVVKLTEAIKYIGFYDDDSGSTVIRKCRECGVWEELEHENRCPVGNALKSSPAEAIKNKWEAKGRNQALLDMHALIPHYFNEAKLKFMDEIAERQDRARTEAEGGSEPMTQCEHDSHIIPCPACKPRAVRKREKRNAKPSEPMSDDKNQPLELKVHARSIWKCKICGHREELKTEDGNEEWAFHCGKAMSMPIAWGITI